MIRKWKLKAIVQKTISYLPYKEKVNYLFQKNITKGVQLTDEYFENKITHAQDHFKFLKKYKTTSSKTQVLELGTGWYPIIPLAFFLSDLDNIISIDLQSWLTKKHCITTFLKFKEWKESGRLNDYLNNINEERWQLIESIIINNEQISLDEILNKIHLKIIIGDARKLDFDNETFDFICSNNTFEHIYKNVLIDIIKEFQRVLKTNGLMSHFIDMTDHFCHFDNKINEYHFLKYSHQKWTIIDNNIQPQNRMRFKDYIQIYEKLNIPIIHTEVRKGSLERLRQITIYKEFEGYSEQELAITHGYIISKKIKQL